jgi:hypothetical protein
MQLELLKKIFHDTNVSVEITVIVIVIDRHEVGIMVATDSNEEEVEEDMHVQDRTILSGESLLLIYHLELGGRT